MGAAILTCDGYQHIATALPGADLPALCREIEEQRNDGYAVIASEGGRLVADAEGPLPEPEYDANYAAQYAYACGYRD